MKKYFFILFIFLSVVLSAQFLHPIVGINLENVGACEVATCTGTYYDNGGIGGSTVASGVAGNYSDGINGVYRIFCSNTPGQCIRATFAQFSTEGGAGCPFDLFRVSNGATQNSPLLFSGCGTGAIGPFTGTIDGCLGFRFWSDVSINRAGWDVAFSCVACAGGPTGTSNADCNFRTPLCSNLPVSASANGPGIVAEGCTPGTCPAGGENHSNWYEVLFATGGTFFFTIAPTIVTEDYDFFVFGPNPTCAALGLPIRCNDSGLGGNTGVGPPGTNPVEIVTGPTFCSQMNVLAGERYYIVVDSWVPPSGPYALTFGGTATFNCAILPVEMTNFSAFYNSGSKQTDLNWTTVIESHVDYYSIERSSDAKNFTEINRVSPYGTGNSKEVRNYHSTDPNPMINEINYYRIITVDKNSHKTVSNLQAVAFQDNDANLSLIPNPASTEVELRFKSQIGKNWGINLYDSKGNNLQLLSYDATLEGINKIVLDVRELNSGLYFINISDGTNFFKRKLVKE